MTNARYIRFLQDIQVVRIVSRQNRVPSNIKMVMAETTKKVLGRSLRVSKRLAELDR